MRLRRPHVRLGGLDLRRGLTDVLRPRAGADERQLRLGLLAIRPRAPQRQVHVGRVDQGDDVPRRHAIAFGDLDLDEPSADFAGDADFGRFDVAGGPGRGVGRGPVAGGQQQRQDHNDGRRGSSLHEIFPSS